MFMRNIKIKPTNTFDEYTEKYKDAYSFYDVLE